MKKNLTTLFAALLCCLFAGAQPLVGTVRPHSNHHTHRLPGVNERRLARLEKMRQANIALRHQSGPLRAQTMTGTKKGLVLLVQFSDVQMKTNAATQWNNRFNQQGFSLNGHVGSVRDYFREQSYGLLTIDFDVVGPLTLTKTRSYYGSAPNSQLDDRAPEMVIDALKLANSQVNYADYDWDGDGEVDQVYVIFAGVTYADTQGYIWPHEWNLAAAQYYGCGSGYQRLDGVYIDTYAVSNELSEDATTLMGIGTACHEFSHCLGYPDFYDTDYSGGTAAQNWDLLDGGSYNGPSGIGEVPSPYTAYERWSAGWIDLIPLTQPAKVTDMPAINQEGVAYILRNTGNTNEYYIFENRQQTGFGQGNRGHGLMVWHIDYDQSAWNNNTVNTNKNHQRMTFLPADGKVGTLRNYSGYYMYEVTAADEAGDPYPGTKKVKSVQQLTWFKAEKNGTTKHQNLIHDIAETSDGKISFIYGDYVALETPEVAMPTDISIDGFTANWMPVEGAISYTLQVEAMSGEPAPATIFTEDFSGFAGVSSAQVGNSVLDNYTQTPGWEVSSLYGTGNASVRIGTATATGYIKTPVIANMEGTLTVEFDAAYYGTDASSVVVTVLNGSQTVATETVKLTASRATYKCTFQNIPAGCRVMFGTTARAKRVYLYNVNIMDMSGTGGIVTTIPDITSTSYTFGPVEVEMYYYRVQAVGSEGASDWSDWMDVDTATGIGEQSVSLSDNKYSGGFYDLMGRRLQRVPQRGIYIQNGKTYMAR